MPAELFSKDQLNKQIMLDFNVQLKQTIQQKHLKCLIINIFAMKCINILSNHVFTHNFLS